MQTRCAEVSDIPWLLEQLRRFDRAFGAARSLVPASETEATERLAKLIGVTAFIVVASETERLGFICGVLSPHPFNPSIIVLTELLWWVVPEHRGGRAAMLLLSAFHEFGLERADWIILTLGLDTAIEPESLTKRGYRLKERSYLLEV